MMFTLSLAALSLVVLQNPSPPQPATGNPAQSGPVQSQTAAPQPPGPAPQTTNAVPAATNAVPQAPNAVPQAPNAVPPAPNVAPQAPNAAQQATNAAPQATGPAPQAPNVVPQSPDKPPEIPNNATKPGTSGASLSNGTASSPAAAWRPVDRIVMVVNEDMLTSQMLQKDLTAFRRQRSISKEDEPRALVEFQRMRVKNMLEVQGGQDMGLDPAIVKHEVNQSVERLREHFNGLAGLANFLESKDMDSVELREQIKNEIYADLWEKSVTGEAAAPGSRISRDRYVRPGIMRLYYESGMQHPENLEQMGGKPQQVVLQNLFIDVEARGGEEKARDLLKTLRQRIVDGEDMGDICEKFDATPATRKDRGLMPAAPEARFAELDPAIGAFLTGAKPGDVSDLLPFKTPDKKLFLRIVKLVERTPPVVPDLNSAGVQDKLMQRIQEDYDQIRKGIALEQLFRASYVWPTELTPR